MTDRGTLAKLGLLASLYLSQRLPFGQLASARVVAELERRLGGSLR